tara:strand:+ start:670 stop:1020 length:351 start_codon:yes stop_codon:yes gene_type:complete
MPSLIKFKDFQKLSLQEQKELQQHDFSDWEGVAEPQILEQQYEAEIHQKKKIEETIKEEPTKEKPMRDYMNPQTWFPDMHSVKATGSLNRGEASERIPDGKSGRSYFKQDLGWDNL